MASGTKHEPQVDPLTAWAQAAGNLLEAVQQDQGKGEMRKQAEMMALMEALDGGQLAPALADRQFMKLTEDLLLAMLRGKRIEVADSDVYAARGEIFAAAQVIYNQAVARGLWTLHPEIREGIETNK